MNPRTPFKADWLRAAASLAGVIALVTLSSCEKPPGLTKPDRFPPNGRSSYDPHSGWWWLGCSPLKSGRIVAARAPWNVTTIVFDYHQDCEAPPASTNDADAVIELDLGFEKQIKILGRGAPEPLGAHECPLDISKTALKSAATRLREAMAVPWMEDYRPMLQRVSQRVEDQDPGKLRYFGERRTGTQTTLLCKAD